MATYTAEGWMTHYEYERFSAALPDFEFVNAHDIVDTASLIKDEGTINRFREAGRIVDEGHKAAREAIENGGWKGMTETELGGHRGAGHAPGGQRLGVELRRPERDIERLAHRARRLHSSHHQGVRRGRAR